MSVNLTDVPPPDDTGSDVFARYRYQAHVAVPFCVDCASGSDIQEVILEYFEDLALRTLTGWRFIQIKTRDLSRGPWRLADLTSSGGALRSLARTYHALGARDYTLEAFLEGPILPSDPLYQLKDNPQDPDANWRLVVQERLGLEQHDLDAFLERLRIRGNLPPRHAIKAQNVSILGADAPGISFGEITAVYDTLVETISAAMASSNTHDYYPTCVMEPDSVPDEIQRMVRAKTLGPQQLVEVLGALMLRPQPLIKRIADRDGRHPTALERKLAAGGAPSRVIDDAMSLRANAAIRRAEIVSAGGSDAALESLDESLRIRANAAGAVHGNEERPAPLIWQTLLSALDTSASTLDSRRLFDQVPDLLLGEICELTDRCTVEWGKARDI